MNLRSLVPLHMCSTELHFDFKVITFVVHLQSDFRSAWNGFGFNRSNSLQGSRDFPGEFIQKFMLEDLFQHDCFNKSEFLFYSLGFFIGYAYNLLHAR